MIERKLDRKIKNMPFRMETEEEDIMMDKRMNDKIFLGKDKDDLFARILKEAAGLE